MTSLAAEPEAKGDGCLSILLGPLGKFQLGLGCTDAWPISIHSQRPHIDTSVDWLDGDSVPDSCCSITIWALVVCVLIAEGILNKKDWVMV